VPCRAPSPQVKATWQEEADKKRFEVVQQCAEAPPVQLSAGELERIAEAKAAPPRGRGGGPEAMDADGGGGKGPRGAKGKGKKGSKKGVVVGGKKGRAKKVGVLAKVSGEARGTTGRGRPWRLLAALGQQLARALAAAPLVARAGVCVCVMSV
jgi:hypothetical protein